MEHKIPSLGPEDDKLMQMAQAEAAMGNAERGASKAQLINGIIRMRDEISGKGKTGALDDEQGKALTEVLNYQLEELHRKGGPKISAEWTAEGGGVAQKVKAFFGAGKRLILKDGTGQEVKTEDMNMVPVNPSAINPQAVSTILRSNPRALAAYSRIVQSGNMEHGLQVLQEQEAAKGVPLKSGLYWAIIQAMHIAPVDTSLVK